MTATVDHVANYPAYLRQLAKNIHAKISTNDFVTLHDIANYLEKPKTWTPNEARAFAERIAHNLIDFGADSAGELIRDYTTKR